MVRKLKVGSLKGKTLKKSSMVEIRDGIVLPITSRSITESTGIKFISKLEVPTKLRTATKDEIEGVLKDHPRYNGKSIPMIQEFDLANVEFLEKKKKEEQLTNIIEIIKYVDMDYLIEDENGNEISLWEDMGIEKGAWDKVAEFLTDSENGLGMTEKDMENLYISIKELQGESIFTTIKKLETLSGRGMFEILSMINKISVDEIENEIEEEE